MLAAAHGRGIRIIVDLVPNHSSDQHVWFQAALDAGPGSRERARYLFRDGKGENGELPPNNWESVFGGPAWTRVIEADGTPGQWYLHLFDSTQPDFDWSNEDVREEFRRVLRFWLDRGVDGFRVDVAHGLMKAAGLPDYTPPADAASMGGDEAHVPYWGQDGVHEVYRDWHKLLAEYDGDRALCAEAWLPTIERDGAVGAPGRDAPGVQLRLPRDRLGCRAPCAPSSTSRCAPTPAVGAPSTWVLSNHDVVRHASRLALTAENPQGHGIGPDSRASRSPTSAFAAPAPRPRVMLALPGSAYLYQGEELGLPEVVDLPGRRAPGSRRGSARRASATDATDAACRSRGRRTAPAYGFSPTGASWLPQPGAVGGASPATSQVDDPASTLVALPRAAVERAGLTRSEPERSSGWTGSRRGRPRIPQRECDRRGEHRLDAAIALPRRHRDRDERPDRRRRAAGRHDGLARRD